MVNQHNLLELHNDFLCDLNSNKNFLVWNTFKFLIFFLALFSIKKNLNSFMVDELNII